MKLFVFSLIATLSGFCLAASPWEVWYRPGDPVNPAWEVDGAPPTFVLIPNERVARRHAERTGAYVGRYPSLLNVDTKFWVVVEDVFEAAVHIHEEHARLVSEVEFSEAQAAKTPERKALDNDFFAFIRLVLTAAGDPRKDADPTPKLGFEELTPLIEEIQVSNPMAAVNLTLKGLSIDSALKRFSATWWDDAQEHDIPVEE